MPIIRSKATFLKSKRQRVDNATRSTHNKRMAAVLLDGDDINVAFTLTTGTTMSEFSFYMTKLQAMLGSLIVSGFSATVQSAAFVCQ